MSLTALEQEMFELERLESMRTFEVVTVNAQGVYATATFFAHYHSTTDSGDLSLVVIQSDGQQLIQHLFNARTWCKLTEIGTAKRHMGKVKVH